MKYVLVVGPWLILKLNELTRDPKVQRCLVGLGLGILALLALSNSLAFTTLIVVVETGACIETNLLCEEVKERWLWTCGLPLFFVWPLVILAYEFLYRADWRLVLLTILIAAGSDIGAMVAGRNWGRIRLPSWLSANKTYEGVRDGTIFGTVLGMVTFRWITPSGTDPINALVVAAFGACLAQTADLAGSYLKRKAGIEKGGSGLIFVQSGSCPRLGRLLEASGHGGFLDRCGSHAAVTLWVASSHYFGLV